jgi:hypothetical protein
VRVKGLWHSSLTVRFIIYPMIVSRLVTLKSPIMRFWLPLTMVLALLHSVSALTAVGWKLQWCGPNIALFQYATDTYFTSSVMRWNPSQVAPNSWETLSECANGYVAISFQPRSPASGSTTFAISTVVDNGLGTRTQSCTWKNIGKKGLDP